MLVSGDFVFTHCLTSEAVAQQKVKLHAEVLLNQASGRDEMCHIPVATHLGGCKPAQTVGPESGLARAQNSKEEEDAQQAGW